jgi:hypothetical protein
VDTIHLSAAHQAPTEVRAVPGDDTHQPDTILLCFTRQASEFWREQVIFSLNREEAAALIVGMGYALGNVPD